jgi:hypothetical protein
VIYIHGFQNIRKPPILILNWFCHKNYLFFEVPEITITHGCLIMAFFLNQNLQFSDSEIVLISEGVVIKKIKYSPKNWLLD